MKKAIIIIAALFGMALAASAQPRAIGARLLGLGANGIEASYQHTMAESQFIQGDLGIFAWDGFTATGTYNWIISSPRWTSEGVWNFYLGAGASLGYVEYGHDAEGRVESNFMFGFVGQVGLEYNFDFPLQLSADLRPVLGWSDGKFYGDGVLGFVPSISVRYRF
ncbi:MAG: hypothetical protein IK143_03265 [Bacteroidales bacterium]|nr:hypothetical protein [Bacteroidales bacterium]